MPTPRHHYLLNVVFLAGLLLLGLNDHLWKDLYGNWLTGKLSDFAGVLILPLVLAAVLRLRTATALVVTVVFFTWWKSPLSEPAIQFANDFTSLSFGRVVDYTDLLAFLVLPLSYLILRSPEQFRLMVLPARTELRLVRFFILPVTAVLFVATSDPDQRFLSPDITDSCSYLASLDTVGSGLVYIPSAFTPDGDGINDVFRVIADTGIASVDLVIFSLENGEVVYSMDSITEFTNAVSWDGTDLDGMIKPAKYEYDARVTSNDRIISLFSKTVTVIPCQTAVGLPEPLNLEFCRFSDQVDAAGYFDENIATAEALDCFD